MAVSATDINYQLQNLSNKISKTELQSTATDLADQLTAATNTQLGFAVGELKGGVESLVQTVDNALGATSSTIAAVSKITANVPNVKNDLVKQMSSTEASQLGSIVESTTESGILDEIIVAGTPESIATAFKNVLGKTTADIEECLTAIAPANIGISVSAAVDDVLSGAFKTPFMSSVSNISSAVTAAVGGLNSTNLFKNVVENYTGQITNTVLSTINIGNNIISNSIVVDIMDNEVFAAVDKAVSFLSIPADLSEFSLRVGIDIDTTSVTTLTAALTALELAGADTSSIQTVINSLSNIQSVFESVSGGISSSIVRGDPELGTPSPDRCVPMGSSSNGTNDGGSGPYDTDFSYIDSLEEMTADLRAITRSVSTTIVHWTSSYIDDNHIDAQAIKQMHISRGATTIGYHYIIKRDGSIQRGRNPNQMGSHAKSSHNPYSIGISFVAGYNCANGTRNPEGYMSPDSINSAQWAALDMYLKAFYTIYSGGEVWGHQDTDPWSKTDPMTNMTAYVKNKFGKTNISPQPSRTYSLEELSEKLFDPVRTSPLDEGTYSGENGRLDPSSLTVIAAGHRLRTDAAQAYLQMVSSARSAGVQWTVTDSYRTYDAQVRLAQQKGLYSEGGLAAKPGTSEHGWGLAVDLGSGANSSGTPQNNWLVANANAFGFRTIPREPWHWEYIA